MVMGFDFSHYTEKSRIDMGLYIRIDAEYLELPTKCARKDCESIYFGSWDSSPSEHTILTMLEKPAVINASRKRYRCKWCGSTFGADCEETEEWENDVDPAFRDKVINFWIKDPEYMSIKKVSEMFGIGPATTKQWEDELANTFYNMHEIAGYERLYFGSFRCKKDNTVHAFVVESDGERSGFAGFVRDYSAEAFTVNDIFTDEGKEYWRFENTENVKQVRYDYMPGIGSALQHMFPNAELAINRRELRHQIDSLLPNYENTTDLSVLLQPQDNISDKDFSDQLVHWASKIPETEPGRDQVMDIMLEVTEDNHLFNSLRLPSAVRIMDDIRTLIDRKVGKNASFNSIMLQIMYSNPAWREKLKEAGRSAGFNIGFVTSFKQSQNQPKEHDFNGSEIIHGHEITASELETLFTDENV